MPSIRLDSQDGVDTRKAKKTSSGAAMTPTKSLHQSGSPNSEEAESEDDQWMRGDELDDGTTSDVGSDDSFGGKFVDDNDTETGNETNPITLDSDAPGETERGLEVRPWRNWDESTRRIQEEAYCNVMATQLNDSWADTEDYQRERDKEMLQYMQDYPLPDWVIPQKQARLGYHRLLERSRWRALGQPIFGFQHHRELIPGSTPSGPATNRPPVLGGNGPANRAGQQPPQAHGLPMNGHHMANHQPPHPHMHRQQSFVYQPGMMQQHHLQGNPPVHINAQRQMPPPGGYPPQHLHQRPMAMPVNVQMPPGHPGMFYGPVNGHPGPHLMPGQSFQDRRVSSRIAATKPEAYNQSSKPNSRRHPPQSSTPEPPPPTPPYKSRPKPAEPPAKLKTKGKTKRKQAEAEEYPWTRQMDFAMAKAYAKWDMSIYSKERLDQMEAVRKLNEEPIAKVDKAKDENQRTRGNRKKDDESSEPEMRSSPSTKEKTDKKNKKAKKATTEDAKEDLKAKHTDGNQEAYHSGNFAFATMEDQALAESLGFNFVSDLIDAGVAGTVPLDACENITIIWAPSKKANYQNLEQARFTVRDTVLTRKQLADTPILNGNAARSIVDFCPDLLWRDTLLRIVAEANFGNKEVRDRYSANGCLCDKATMTKRISAALGQKQKQGKTGGYGPGEEEWYTENLREYRQYANWFGPRKDHRSAFRTVNTGVKRKADEISTTSSEPATPITKTEPPAIVVDAAKAGDDVEEERDGEDEDQDLIGEGGEFVRDNVDGRDDHEGEYMMSGGNPDAPRLLEERAQSPVAGIFSASPATGDQALGEDDLNMGESGDEDDWYSIEGSDDADAMDQD